MKKSLWILFFFLVSGIGFAQYHPVSNESSIHFTIKNFGFNVGGSFSGIEGNVRFDPDNLSTAAFDVSVDATSINTDNNLRDGHLRGADYLDVKNCPKILFVSETVHPARKKGSYRMTGKLTIKRVTKEVSFPFTAEPSGKGYLFTGGFKINRKDFGVGGSSTISDNLTVDLKVLVE